MTRRLPHPPPFEVIQPALKAQPLLWVTSLKRIGVLSGESFCCLGPAPVREGKQQAWAWLEEVAASLYNLCRDWQGPRQRELGKGRECRRGRGLMKGEGFKWRETQSGEEILPTPQAQPMESPL